MEDLLNWLLLYQWSVVHISNPEPLYKLYIDYITTILINILFLRIYVYLYLLKLLANIYFCPNTYDLLLLRYSCMRSFCKFVQEFFFYHLLSLSLSLFFSFSLCCFFFFCIFYYSFVCLYIFTKTFFLLHKYIAPGSIHGHHHHTSLREQLQFTTAIPQSTGNIAPGTQRSIFNRLGIRKPSLLSLSSPNPIPGGGGAAARTFSLDDLLRPPPRRKIG